MSNLALKEDKVNLLEFTLEELEVWFEQELGEPKFRARQVWQWLWQKLARDFTEMSNISKNLRQILPQKAYIGWPEIDSAQVSQDGTVKFLLRFQDGAKAETVLIPAEDHNGAIRWSQCLSTQIGCPMACRFCATGQMGLERNMSMGEIMAQVLVGKEYLNDRRPDWPILRNLVFMGMGEPLLNLDALLPALKSMAHDKGLNFSPRRMTVSTCGLEKGLKELGESGLAYLAVSLHAPTQELREKIMPGAASWPLHKMLEALKKYPLKTRERITFEYLLLGGINDSIECARELGRLMGQIKAKLNLIIYNPSPGLPFNAPEPENVEKFLAYLHSRNITAIVRKSRGADILAACGQLKASREAIYAGS